jgi:large subunit ribosomal protein L12
MTLEYIHAALLLHHAKKPIDKENLTALMNAAGIIPDETRINLLIEVLKEVPLNFDKMHEDAQFNTLVATQTSVEIAHEVAEEKKEEEDNISTGLEQLFG